MARASFAAGCFWDVEAAFRNVAGVRATAVGYAGGHVANPDYAAVCTGRTGHAETVLVEYDPQAVSYEELLAAFWACHEPARRHRQAAGRASQYRSVIFWHDETQRVAAEASLTAERAAGRHRGRVVTEIRPAGDFWPAEDEHQQYLEKRAGGRLALP